MFVLKDTGERGGEVLVKASVFDLLSVEEGLTFAVLHLKHILADHESETDWAFRDTFASRLKDAEANIREIRAVRDEREKVLDERDRKAS